MPEDGYVMEKSLFSAQSGGKEVQDRVAASGKDPVLYYSMADGTVCPECMRKQPAVHGEKKLHSRGTE